MSTVELSINGSSLETHMKRSIEQLINVNIRSLDDEILNINKEHSDMMTVEIDNKLKNMCDVQIPSLIKSTFAKNLSNQIKENYKELLHKFADITEETIKTETVKVLDEFTQNKSNDIIIGKFCDKIIANKTNPPVIDSPTLDVIEKDLRRVNRNLETVKNQNVFNNIIWMLSGTMIVAMWLTNNKKQRCCY